MSNTDQPVVVTNVSWRDLCPWTIIFKSLSSATSVTVIVLALVGLVLMPVGWMLSDTIFLSEELRADSAIASLVDANQKPYKRVFMATDPEANSVNLLGQRLSGPRMVFTQIVHPFQQLFSIPPFLTAADGTTHGTSRWSVRAFLYLLGGCTWTLFLWSFIGLGICRVCLLKLTRNEPVGLDDAVEFALDKTMSAVGAVGTPLLTMAVLCIPGFLLGILMGMDLGVLLVGVLWFAVLAIGLAMAFLLFGLMFGWPLMVASVACEGQNSFDAMTRSYAYVTQRPVHYVMYLLIAMVFGGSCWFVVANIVDGGINLSYWSTSFGTSLVGGDADRMNVIRSVSPPTAIVEGKTEVVEPTYMLSGGRTMIGIWTWFARNAAAAFIYGLFWCMMSAIYLLLRKDVDDTEMDEIFIVDERRTYELPPLKTDEKGIPQVQKPVPTDEDADPDQSTES